MKGNESVNFQINLSNEEKVKFKAPEVQPKKYRKSEAKKVKKESIPNAFIRHIRSLGFQETDASVLYENKDDWMGISTGQLIRFEQFCFEMILSRFYHQPSKESKIRCSSQRCHFEAPSTSKSLVEHCQKIHGWKPIPCSFENCNFVAYSKGSSAIHRAGFHSKYRDFADKEFRCTWMNCKSSFRFHSLLQVHLRIHTNNLLECVFCPYRTNQPSEMKNHYRFHFQVFDLKCDYCDKKFVSLKYLNRHHSDMHSDKSFTCHICKKYTGPRFILQRHILTKHNLWSKWNDTKQSFETYPRE